MNPRSNQPKNSRNDSFRCAPGEAAKTSFTSRRKAGRNMPHLPSGNLACSIRRYRHLVGNQNRRSAVNWRLRLSDYDGFRN